MPTTPPPGQPPGTPPGPHQPVARSTPYLQIAEEIRKAIMDQGLRPGDRIPSYKDLAHRFGVAVPTVQNAVMILVGQGWLEIRQGSGTYVSDLDFAPSGLDRMSRYMRTGRIYPKGESATILSAELVPAPSYISEALAIAPGAMVVRRLRVTRRDGRVVSMSTSWLPGQFADTVPTLLEPIPIPMGTIGAVCQATGITPAVMPAGLDQLMARAATQAEAPVLGVTVGEPVLAAANWFYGQYPPTPPDVIGDDVVIEYGDAVYPQGRQAAYEYHLGNGHTHG